MLDWKNAKVIQTENNRSHRWIMEAVKIRKRAHRTINQDEGAYQLSYTWDSILQRHRGDLTLIKWLGGVVFPTLRWNDQPGYTPEVTATSS